MDLRYEDLTPAHHCAGLLWLEKMSQATFWNLSTKEAATLIGLEESTYIELTTKAHQGQAITLQSEAMEHLSLLLGLHKRLCLLCSNEGMAYSTFNRANSGELLQGTSIRAFLLENKSITALYAVNLYLQNHIHHE